MLEITKGYQVKHKAGPMKGQTMFFKSKARAEAHVKKWKYQIYIGQTHILCIMDGYKLTKEAMKKAKDAQNANYAKTLGSNDQRRNQADVRRYKQNTP